MLIPDLGTFKYWKTIFLSIESDDTLKVEKKERKK